MFTTPCFIRKNTPELRKKLEELGYTPNSYECFWDDNNRYLITFISPTGFDGFGLCITDCCILYNKSYIDCGDNEDLFLALAALRDDTDNKQWFIMDYGFQKTWIFSETKHLDINHPLLLKVYKATAEELIEHFKED